MWGYKFEDIMSLAALLRNTCNEKQVSTLKDNGINSKSERPSKHLLSVYRC